MVSPNNLSIFVVSGESLIPQSPTWLQAYPWPGHPFAMQTPFSSSGLASLPSGPNSALTAQQQMQFVGNQENGAVGGTEETQQQLYGPNYYQNQQGKNSRSGQKRKEKRLPLQPKQEERKLEVGKHLAGAILGPRGETIEKIRRDSGADVDISEVKIICHNIDSMKLSYFNCILFFNRKGYTLLEPRTGL